MEDRVITKQHTFNYELKHKAFLEKYTKSESISFFNDESINTDKLTLELIDSLIKDKFFDSYNFNENEVCDFVTDYKDLIYVNSFIYRCPLFAREHLEFIADTFKEQLDEDPIIWQNIIGIFMETPRCHNRSFLMKYKNKFDWNLFSKCIFNNDALEKKMSYYGAYDKIVAIIRDYTIEHLEEIIFGK